MNLPNVTLDVSNTKEITPGISAGNGKKIYSIFFRILASTMVLWMLWWIWENGISDFLHVGYGGVCPVGHYCREGYTLPKPCPDGSYQDEEGKTYCKSCPAGFFCLAKASTFNDSVCPSGSYCPINTSVPYLCDEGTFNNLTGQEAESSCVSCTAGMYCEGNGLSKPTALCYGGWFCRNGSTNPTPDGGNIL